jgi:hypothetical protein
MIEALLNEDAHSTIQELRTIPIVRDFFALWRRDKEAERRSSKMPSPTSPPLPELNIPPVSSPAAIAPEKQTVARHLTGFLHSSGSSTPKSPNPARNSYATPRVWLTPHTNDQALKRSATSSTSTAETSTGARPSLTAPSSQPGPVRFSRSQCVPHETLKGAIETHQSLAHDAGPRGREPLVFLAVTREESALRRPPIRKGSTPELIQLSLERGLDRDVPALTRNTDTQAGGISADGYHLIPVPILSPQDVSQRGESRQATFMETPEESTSITPDSLATPGVVRVGVGREIDRNLDSLVVLDPELYPLSSAQQASPRTSSPSAESQVIPRARKTPPTLDGGNRSARFFVNDGTGLVDLSAAPPPRSPVSSTPLTVGPEFPKAPALNDGGEQFGEIVDLVQRKAPRLAQSVEWLIFPEPPTHDPRISRGNSEHFSVVSGNSTIPTLSSPRSTSSWTSQSSPISPSGVYTQRYRSRVSLGSVVERRLSLDSLVASEFEAPYLSRNIAASQVSHTNESSDAIHMVLNALAIPSVTPRGRASYSSQETDSTGLDENSGAISLSSSLYDRHGLPLSKAAIIAPKSTPPPRPPRSALRKSNRFSAGVVSRLNEPLANAGLNGEISTDLPSLKPAVVARHDSLIGSSLHSPASQQALLEPPSPPFPLISQHKWCKSNLPYISQSVPDKHESTHPGANELDIMPATPFTPSFNSNGNAGIVQIKAIHAKSDIIVSFKVPRVEMTLADLRTDLKRRLREAGGLELGNFSLKYLPPQSDRRTTASTGARQRCLSVTSTSDMSSMIDLDNDIEWQKALQINTKIIIRII